MMIKPSLFFLILLVLSISEGSVLPDYLEVAIAVIVSVLTSYNFSFYIDTVFIFFIF